MAVHNQFPSKWPTSYRYSCWHSYVTVQRGISYLCGGTRVSIPGVEQKKSHSRSTHPPPSIGSQIFLTYLRLQCWCFALAPGTWWSTTWWYNLCISLYSVYLVIADCLNKYNSYDTLFWFLFCSKMFNSYIYMNIIWIPSYKISSFLQFIWCIGNIHFVLGYTNIWLIKGNNP